MSFRQRRYGLGSKLVEVLKFRPMTSSDDCEAVAQAKPVDTRITFWGRFLRAYSLDELLQFLNALIGPRPRTGDGLLQNPV